MGRRFLPAATLVFLCAGFAFGQSAAPKVEAPDYGRIESVIQSQCLACHSGGSKMGGLLMETHEGVMKGGKSGPSVIPGKSGESRLLLMMEGKVEPRMPFGAEPLPKETIDLFKAWIDAGAKGPALGATKPSSLAPPVIPDIKPRGGAVSPIGAVAFSPDGKLLAVGGFKAVRLIEPASGHARATLTGHSELVRALAFTPDGNRLAAAGGEPAREGEIKIWDVGTGNLLRTLHGHKDCIYSIAISPDGKWLASSSYDKMIMVWNLETGEPRTFKDHIDAVFAVAFSPDGKWLASGAADRTVKVWDVLTGQRFYTLGEPLDGVTAVAFHPSGKQVAAAGLDKIIRVWNVTEKAGALAKSTYAHEDAVLRLIYSPDGKRLISSSSDRTIRIWNAETLAPIRVLETQSDWVDALGISPEGKWLVAGRYDGTLGIYDLDAQRAVLGPLTVFEAVEQAAPLASTRQATSN